MLSKVPVLPDPDAARQLLQQELSRSAYSTELTPFERFTKWLIESINNLFNFRGQQSSTLLSVLTLSIFAVIIVSLICIIVFNPINSKKNTSSSQIFDDEISSKDNCLNEIQKTSSAKNWDECFIWEFRLLVLILGEKDIISVTPGLTAHEAITSAQNSMKDISNELQWADEIFEMLRYGIGSTTQYNVKQMHELTESISTHSPRRQPVDMPNDHRKLTPVIDDSAAGDFRE